MQNVILLVAAAIHIGCTGIMVVAYGWTSTLSLPTNRQLLLRPPFAVLSQRCSSSTTTLASKLVDDDDDEVDRYSSSSSSSSSIPRRRDVLHQFVMTATTSAAAGLAVSGMAIPALAEQQQEEKESLYAPKFVQEYSDFIKTSEGWSYRDVTTTTTGRNNNDGETPSLGDRVVYDWSGYTIGYFGRPFEAKGGPQGGAFDKRDVDYSRTVLGSGEVVKGLECAMKTMKVGTVRQVIVPFGALSYPSDDLTHDRVGPKPTTFSGQRALNFVLENPRVDRTLLFNVKLIRIDKPDGKGGFKRG